MTAGQNDQSERLFSNATRVLRHAGPLLVLVGALSGTSALTGCGSADSADSADASNAPVPVLRGVYKTEAGTASNATVDANAIAAINFEDASHYLARLASCSDKSPDTCSVTGTYQVTADSLTLVDDKGATTKLSIKVTDFAKTGDTHFASIPSGDPSSSSSSSGGTSSGGSSGSGTSLVTGSATPLIQTTTPLLANSFSATDPATGSTQDMQALNLGTICLRKGDYNYGGLGDCVMNVLPG